MTDEAPTPTLTDVTSLPELLARASETYGSLRKMAAYATAHDHPISGQELSRLSRGQMSGRPKPATVRAIAVACRVPVEQVAALVGVVDHGPWVPSDLSAYLPPNVRRALDDLITTLVSTQSSGTSLMFPSMSDPRDMVAGQSTAHEREDDDVVAAVESGAAERAHRRRTHEGRGAQGEREQDSSGDRADGG